MIRQGYSLSEKKAIADASKYYDEKLQQAPGNVRYNHFQAILQQAQGDEKQAEALYLKTVGIQSHNVMARNDLALHLARNGRYSDSVDEFKKAMLIQEDQPTLRKNLGAVLSRTGQYPVALEHAMRAVHLNPSDSMSHRNVAMIYEAMGDGRSSLHHNLQSIQLEQAAHESNLHTKAFRSAAVQIVAKGGDISMAHSLMDAARKSEGKRIDLPTTERTFEIIRRINRRKGDMEAELAAQEAKEAEKGARVNKYKSMVMARFDSLKKQQERQDGGGAS